MHILCPSSNIGGDVEAISTASVMWHPPAKARVSLGVESYRYRIGSVWRRLCYTTSCDGVRRQVRKTRQLLHLRRVRLAYTQTMVETGSAGLGKQNLNMWSLFAFSKQCCFVLPGMQSWRESMLAWWCVCTRLVGEVWFCAGVLRPPNPEVRHFSRHIRGGKTFF